MDHKEMVAYLRTPKAIRERCEGIAALAADGRLAHFTLHADRLPEVARYVLAEMRSNYPTLAIPLHSRWRHFDAERLAILQEKLAPLAPLDAAKAKAELAIVSVLLDAGAGAEWRYTDSAGKTYTRSEGLAAASFDMFVAGGFAADPDAPLQVDSSELKAIGRRELGNFFQVSPSNRLTGFDGRLGLLHKLAHAVQNHSKIFGDIEPRLGNIVTYLESHAGNGKIAARRILATLIEGLGSIWPGRIIFGGLNLGDVWRHSGLAAASGSANDGQDLVPFHKLSQWLTYSMVEPLEEAGFDITGLDELTGLAEYRNGGLFLDMEVLKPRDPGLLSQALKADSEAVVEWRAMTVVLLDRVAEIIRGELGLSPLDLPLAKVLQGGTWTAGRKVAASKRPDGSPPIKLASDGTVF